MKKTIIWFRNDLRLKDNPALYNAAQRGMIIPVYIFDDETAAKWKIGSASKWWLHKSLVALAADFAALGISLILLKGSPQEILEKLLVKSGADAVFWNRRYEPYFIKEDAAIKRALEELGVQVQSFKASLLFEPWEIKNKQGDNYKVFTPFWNYCLSLPQPDEPLAIPKLRPIAVNIKSDHIDSFQLLPKKPDWSGGLAAEWQPGENGAITLLNYFLDNSINNYANGRDIPALGSTSKLSAYLHFGEISPRQIWYCVHFNAQINSNANERHNLQKFLAEIGWREFSYNLLYHYPGLPDKPFNTKFANFPWQEDSKNLHLWQQGQTGYPIVDAGMRQLWQTGYMHNRVRMIVASFLTKHLLINWQEGAKWFWDTLVDADLASNSVGWQWVAGCGADAAPYFRIFNPVLQGKKFDPNGDYVRKWIPQLAHIDNKYSHCPWELGKTIKNYPAPIVDHAQARQRAMKAYNPKTASVLIP